MKPVAVILLACLALAACSKPKPPEAPKTEAAPAQTPVSANDAWAGKYEGDLMVRISGTPSEHRVMLVTAGADGCSGDTGLAGGLVAQSVSDSELLLSLHPDDQAICRIHLSRQDDRLTVSEDGACDAYHGKTCSFSGVATRLRP